MYASNDDAILTLFQMQSWLHSAQWRRSYTLFLSFFNIPRQRLSASVVRHGCSYNNRLHLNCGSDNLSHSHTTRRRKVPNRLYSYSRVGLVAWTRLWSICARAATPIGQSWRIFVINLRVGVYVTQMSQQSHSGTSTRTLDECVRSCV